MKNNREKAQELIAKKLGNSHLAQLAARALTFSFNHGFCDYTEDEELFKLMEPLICEYCCMFHSLEDCLQYGADNYRKCGKTKEERQKNFKLEIF